MSGRLHGAGSKRVRAPLEHGQPRHQADAVQRTDARGGRRRLGQVADAAPTARASGASAGAGATRRRGRTSACDPARPRRACRRPRARSASAARRAPRRPSAPGATRPLRGWSTSTSCRPMTSASRIGDRVRAAGRRRRRGAGPTTVPASSRAGSAMPPSTVIPCSRLYVASRTSVLQPRRDPATRDAPPRSRVVDATVKETALDRPKGQISRSRGRSPRRAWGARRCACASTRGPAPRRSAT